MTQKKENKMERVTQWDAELTQWDAEQGRTVESHDVDQVKVDAIIGDMLNASSWSYGPVLLVANNGGGSIILDGHHRIAALQRLIDAGGAPGWIYDGIPAYELGVDDYEAILLAVPDACTLDEYDIHIYVGEDETYASARLRV